MKSRLTSLWAQQHSKGFSLLEVMVALAIMATAIVAIFQLYSINLRNTAKAEDYSKAIFYGRSMMDEAYSLKDPSDASDSREYEHRYKSVREVGVHSESEDSHTKLYDVTVTVSWPPSGQFRIKGLRSVYEQKK